MLVARTLATGAERLLARSLSRDDQEGFAAMDVWPNYAFTPDGSALIFSSGGHLQRLSLTAGATPVVVPVKIPVDIALAPTVTWQEKVADGPVEARILRRAQQSPDGRVDRVRGVRPLLAAAAAGRQADRVASTPDR